MIPVQLMAVGYLLDLHSVHGGLVRHVLPVVRGERDYDFAGLADFMRDLGQLEPVAVRGNELCHGYNRLAVAVFDLHWKFIRVSPSRQIP